MHESSERFNTSCPSGFQPFQRDTLCEDSARPHARYYGAGSLGNTFPRSAFRRMTGELPVGHRLDILRSCAYISFGHMLIIRVMEHHASAS